MEDSGSYFGSTAYSCIYHKIDYSVILRFSFLNRKLIVYGILGTIFLEMYKELFKNGQLFFIVCLWLSLQSLSFLQTVV